MEQLIKQLYKSFLDCPVICIDSRKITAGCLFFGLKGENVDGSVYGEEAIKQGAAYAIVKKGACTIVDGVVIVEDPLEVLQMLGAFHRRQLTIPVIGITGSNGKTTTKELVTRVLASSLKVKATSGNLNNHIGVPLTLLSINSDDEIAVVEMGANHCGEIAALSGLALPTHGIVTNIGKAHLEGFGGIEGVKRGKSELFDNLAQSQGIAFVNFNEPFLLDLSQHVGQRIQYGFSDNAEHAESRYTFALNHDKAGVTIHFRDAQDVLWSAQSALFGEFNYANIATAITVGLAFEIPGDRICKAISSYIPQNNRAQTIEIAQRTFILDAYNANPSSMRLAIHSFGEIAHSDKFMVLGSMMELGEYAEDEHKEIAEVAIGLRDVTTVFVGSQFHRAAKTFNQLWFPDVESFRKEFPTYIPANALVLVKGSRSMHLESLLAGLE